MVVHLIVMVVYLIVMVVYLIVMVVYLIVMVVYLIVMVVYLIVMVVYLIVNGSMPETVRSKNFHMDHEKDCLWPICSGRKSCCYQANDSPSSTEWCSFYP